MNMKLAGMIKYSSPVKQEKQPDLNKPNNDSSGATTPPTALHTSTAEVVFYSRDQINVEAEKTSLVKQRYCHERLTFPRLKGFNEIFRIKGELLNSWLNVI